MHHHSILYFMYRLISFILFISSHYINSFMNHSSPLHSHLQHSKLISDQIENEKPTILLVGLNSPQNVFAIGQWLLSSNVEFNKEEFIPIYKQLDQSSYISQTIISNQIQILSSSQLRVMSFSLDIEENNEALVEKIILLQTAISILNNTNQNTQLYGLKQSAEQSNKQFMAKLQKYIYAPNISTIYLHDFRNEAKSNQLVVKVEEDHLIPHQQQLQINQHNEIVLRVGNESIKKEVDKICHSRETIINQLLVGIFNVVREREFSEEEMVRSIYAAKENQVNPEYTLQQFIEQYIFNYKMQTQLQPYYSLVKKKYSANWECECFQTQPELVHLHLICEMNIMYEHFCKGSVTVQQFLTHVLSLVNELSPWLSKQERFQYLPRILSILEVLIKQINQLKALGASSFLEKMVEHEYKKFRPSFKGILKLTLSIQPKEKQQKYFYEGYLYLIDQFFERCSFTIHEKKEVSESKYFRQMQLKMFTAKKNHEEHRQIIKTIKDLFFVYKNRNQIKQQFQKYFAFNRILFSCAQLLSVVGKETIAFKIYKQLKFVIRAQQSLQTILIDVSDKAESYHEFSQYLWKIGQNQLALKYSQLAYEHDEEYLQSLIEMKERIMKGEYSKQEINAMEMVLKTHSHDEYLQEGVGIEEEIEGLSEREQPMLIK